MREKGVHKIPVYLRSEATSLNENDEKGEVVSRNMWHIRRDMGNAE